MTEGRKNLGHIKAEVVKVVRDIDDTAARTLLMREVDKMGEGMVKQIDDLFKAKEKELGGGA